MFDVLVAPQLRSVQAAAESLSQAKARLLLSVLLFSLERLERKPGDVRSDLRAAYLASLPALLAAGQGCLALDACFWKSLRSVLNHFYDLQPGQPRGCSTPAGLVEARVDPGPGCDRSASGEYLSADQGAAPKGCCSLVRLRPATFLLRRRCQGGWRRRCARPSCPPAPQAEPAAGAPQASAAALRTAVPPRCE